MYNGLFRSTQVWIIITKRQCLGQKEKETRGILTTPTYLQRVHKSKSKSIDTDATHEPNSYVNWIAYVFLDLQMRYIRDY